METIDFETLHEYQDHETGGILLDVEISSSISTRLKAHVDSGAANCLFNGQYAELIGLTVNSGEKKNFSTPDGGTIVGYGHEISMIVLGHTVSSIVYFTNHVGFQRNVLGRQGWLHHFRFGLTVYERKLYLGKYS